MLRRCGSLWSHPAWPAPTEKSVISRNGPTNNSPDVPLSLSRHRKHPRPRGLLGGGGLSRSCRPHRARRQRAQRAGSSISSAAAVPISTRGPRRCTVLIRPAEPILAAYAARRNADCMVNAVKARRYRDFPTAGQQQGGKAENQQQVCGEGRCLAAARHGRPQRPAGASTARRGDAGRETSHHRHRSTETTSDARRRRGCTSVVQAQGSTRQRHTHTHRKDV